MKNKIIIALMLSLLIFTSCKSQEKVEKEDDIELVKIEDTATEKQDEPEKLEEKEELSEQPIKEEVAEKPIEKEKPIKEPIVEKPIEVEKPIIQEELPEQVEKQEFNITMSIDCSTILDNMDLLDPLKAPLVPENGTILEQVTLEVTKGQSVFDVLLSETRERKIHMEYVDTPLYNSAYIEGINNFYEFDVGELSGWMYKVNGEFPSYGSSKYELLENDVVEWIYTCDLGKDIGNEYGVDNQGGEVNE